MRNKFKIFRDTPRNNSNQPVSIVGLTIAYVFVCVFIIIGLPAPHTGSSNPIPYEDLPEAIAVFVGLYFIILLLLMIMGKVRQKLSNKY